MFSCQRCVKTCDDREADAVLSNPANSHSPLLKVCDACAERQAKASAAAGLGLLEVISAAVLALFASCRP
jgi:hypothetical protein